LGKQNKIFALFLKNIRAEFLALQINHDQLLTDYTRIQPTLLQLRQGLASEQGKIEELEKQLLESKRSQQEMFDAEVERYKK
jgi:hypothetical protein